MATRTPELEAGPETVASDLAGMPSFFIDPAGAAARVHTNWFWVGPLILVSVVSMITTYLLTPIALHVAEIAPPPNVPPEQFSKMVGISMKVQMYAAPLFVALFYAIQAALLLGMSAITAVQAKFKNLVNLVAGCGLIQMLALVAGAAVVKMKGDIGSMAELRPALGLDIFMPEGSNKFLAAFMGTFSIFEIWWVVMLVLVYSASFRTSKGKAFAIISPLVLLNIAFRLLGALGTR